MKAHTLLPSGWNPKAAGDRVLGTLSNICLPAVKGAHDSDFLILDGKAYVVYMANDVEPGENPVWPHVYNALSIVDVATGRVELTKTFAASGKAYENETLPVGACFVARIIQKDARTLRCFFASEQPGVRESQTWYLDYDLKHQEFDWTIHRLELETDEGVFPMQPQYFYRQAVAQGFTGKRQTYGAYMIDSFKRFDGRIHAVVNNYPIGQNAWATLNDDLTRVTLLGNLFRPNEAKLTESAVNRLPDGTWLAISRQEERGCNYMFARSSDGITWTPHEYWALVPNGTSSKPTFDRFGGVYYLGWQESTQINGACRSVFNIDVSVDGLNWERKYRFETDKSFQYPTFRDYRGAVYLTVTQGDSSDSRKERIMFGRLE
jgi:hypothetical protein